MENMNWRDELTADELAEIEAWFAEVNTLNEPLNDQDNRDGPHALPVAA